MENKVLMSVVVIFLGFSLLLISDAVPVSRTLKSFRSEVAVHSLLAQSEIMTKSYKLSTIERRMDIETADYSEPGANSNHDPNAPSRA